MSVAIFPSSIIGIVGTAVAIGAVAAIFYTNAKNSNANQTNQNYKDAIDANAAALEAMKGKSQECITAHNESLKLIHNLEGQVDILKNIPLGGINEQLTKQTGILTQMAARLETNATIVKHESEAQGLLTHTENTK